MGGGASSTAPTSAGSNGSGASKVSSSVSPASVLSAKDKLRIKDLEMQVRDLEARVRDAEAQCQAVPHGTIQGFALAHPSLVGVGLSSHFDSSPEAATPQPPHVSRPTAVESSTDYAKHMALSAARRDESHMKAVFERHKDAKGGLSKTALMAALTEVKAPVLSTSEGNSEDDLFRRADSNMSGAVDFNECVSRLLKSMPIAANWCAVTGPLSGS